MSNIFLDYPLARDFILVNTTTNQQFNLTTGSKNIPPGAAGNLRAFDVDFCELKYKYYYFPQVKQIFDDGFITISPINGTLPTVCAWEPTTVITSGSGAGGSTNSQGGVGYVTVTQGDGAATALNDALLVSLPLLKTIEDYPLAGGGIDKVMRISLNPQGIGQVGNIYLEDYAAVTTDSASTNLTQITMPLNSSIIYELYFTVLCTNGPNIGKTMGLVRTIHIGSNSVGIQSHFVQSTFTKRDLPWNFTSTYSGSTISWAILGTTGDTVQWRINAMKRILSI